MYYLVILLILVLAEPDEPVKQTIEPVITECLNGRGMVINGELWLCTNTGMKS